MPWTETAPMNERRRFVVDCEEDLYSMRELCQRYKLSRKTGYKWLARYAADGLGGLHERSRAPHHCPHSADGEPAYEGEPHPDVTATAPCIGHVHR